MYENIKVEAGWIPHTTSIRPVPSDTIVRVVSECGIEEEGRAGDFSWTRYSPPEDYQIKGFRIIKLIHALEDVSGEVATLVPDSSTNSPVEEAKSFKEGFDVVCEGSGVTLIKQSLYTLKIQDTSVIMDKEQTLNLYEILKEVLEIE